MAKCTDGFNFVQLLEIVKVLPKIRGKSLSYHWSDNAAHDYFTDKTDTFYRSLSFRISEENTYTARHTRFKLSCCYFTSTGVAFSDNCTLDVCFDVAWFMSGINQHKNKIVLNNIESEVMQIGVDDNDNYINLKDEEFTEEWLFQLMTRYDIPPYEDMLVLKEMRECMMQHDYPFSFSLKYNNEEDLNIFLDKIYNFLLEQE